MRSSGTAWQPSCRGLDWSCRGQRAAILPGGSLAHAAWDKRCGAMMLVRGPQYCFPMRHYPFPMRHYPFSIRCWIQPSRGDPRKGRCNGNRKPCPREQGGALFDALASALLLAGSARGEGTVYLGKRGIKEGTMSQLYQESIEVRGARENNLKNVSLRIPKRKITILTGVSGSGKSSNV